MAEDQLDGPVDGQASVRAEQDEPVGQVLRRAGGPSWARDEPTAVATTLEEMRVLAVRPEDTQRVTGGPHLVTTTDQRPSASRRNTACPASASRVTVVPLATSTESSGQGSPRAMR